MVSRRRLLIGSAAAMGTVGLGIAGATAWASTRRTALESLLGGGLPLPDGTVVPVDYLSRPGWGANESWRSWPAGPEEWYPALNEYQRVKYQRYPVQCITVHHTAGGTPSSAAAAALEVRNIYHDQSVNRGWGDIGYNLLIDPFGIVYEGRFSVDERWPIFGPEGGMDPPMTTGAHVGGYNTGNIGICLLGNFEPAGVLPTAAARGALVQVLAALCRLCDIDPRGFVNYYNPVPAATSWDTNTQAVPERHDTNTVLGVSAHRNWASTDCPGGTFYATLDQVRNEVAALIPPPVPPPPRIRQDPTGAPPAPATPERPVPSDVPVPPSAGRPLPPGPGMP